MADDLPHVAGGAPGTKKPGSSFLSKKAVGGLTVGTILLIVAGGYIVLRFYKNRGASSSSSATQQAAAAAAAQQAAQDQLYGAPSPGSAGPSSSGTGAGGGASYTDNVSWQSAAVNYLVARGYDSVLANQAIGDYLAGNTLTTQEHALVNLAIAAIGAPPVAPPPSLTVSPPVTGPPITSPPAPIPNPIHGGNPPPGLHPPVPVPVQHPSPPPLAGYQQVTVVHFGNPAPWNSTISGIAGHYGYGGDWEAVWNDPRNAGLKAKRGKPELIQPGDVVYVKPR